MNRPTRKSWRTHGWLLLAVLLQLGIGAIRHRSTQELTERWETGEGLERLAAAHAVLNRGDGTVNPLGSDLATDLLEREPDARVRRLAFTSDVCKWTDPAPQLAAVVDGLERGRPSALIDFVLQCRKVGGITVGSSSAMRRCELDWYFEAQEAEAWPPGTADRILEDLAPWLDAVRGYLRDH